jgi:MFS transporter, DHA1 family, multidrug resistance protein
MPKVTNTEKFFELRLNILLSTLLAFASISTDLYLPAMPMMGLALGASQDQMQYTITAYLIGFSLGQLFWGPVGDKYGRRWPIAIGLVLFILGSAGCALATDAHQLIGFRVVQALGACASVVLARAIVRDFYARDRAAKVLSTLMTIMAIAPLIGPSVGGLILRVAPWQAIFWALVVIGVATLAALFTVPESLKPERRNSEPLDRAFSAYPGLAIDRRLMGYAGAIGFYYAAVFAYISSSSFAFINYHHLTPQAYGVIFAVSIIGLMLANMVNSRLVSRMGGERMLRIGAAGAALSGLIVAAVTLTDFGGFWGLAVSLWLFAAMNGFINANAVSGALSYFPQRAGAVSALLGAIQYGSGIFGSAIAGAAADGTPRPMGLVIFGATLGCLLCAFLIQKTSKAH